MASACETTCRGRSSVSIKSDEPVVERLRLKNQISLWSKGANRRAASAVTVVLRIFLCAAWCDVFSLVYIFYLGFHSSHSIAFPHCPSTARCDSDNLSAPLCLFPARTGDLSLISAAATPASPPEFNSSSSDTDGRTRTNSQTRRTSRLSAINHDGVVGDNGGYVTGGGSDGADGRSAGLGGRFGGDVGRLWMLEDGGYLCVDLLLERTLEELAEGLAVAAR